MKPGTATAEGADPTQRSATMVLSSDLVSFGDIKSGTSPPPRGGGQSLTGPHLPTYVLDLKPGRGWLRRESAGAARRARCPAPYAASWPCGSELKARQKACNRFDVRAREERGRLLRPFRDDLCFRGHDFGRHVGCPNPGMSSRWRRHCLSSMFSSSYLMLSCL